MRLASNRRRCTLFSLARFSGRGQGEGCEHSTWASDPSRDWGNPHPASPGLPGEEDVAGRSRAGLLLVYAWGFGVLIPYLLATSKTPSATLIGWPAFLLLLGVMISRGVAGDRWCLGGWLSAAVLAAVVPGAIGRSGVGYRTPPNFGVIARPPEKLLELL